jgi:hypothetical protein
MGRKLGGAGRHEQIRAFVATPRRRRAARRRRSADATTRGNERECERLQRVRMRAGRKQGRDSVACEATASRAREARAELPLRKRRLRDLGGASGLPNPRRAHDRHRRRRRFAIEVKPTRLLQNAREAEAVMGVRRSCPDRPPRTSLGYR